jgi:Family of unknown function (DUF5372)
VSRPAEVTVTRHRDALEGQRLRVLGVLRRHGGTELLVVLPDGSKRLIPRAWTDAAADAAGGSAAATLGTVSDLLAACVLVRGLSARRADQEGQAARQSPVKEDNRAACPAQPAAGRVSGATPDGVPSAPRMPGHRRGHAAGRPDREGGGSGRGASHDLDGGERW